MYIHDYDWSKWISILGEVRGCSVGLPPPPPNLKKKVGDRTEYNLQWIKVIDINLFTIYDFADLKFG